MYDEIRKMYESGEIRKLLAWCGVPKDCWDDLAQDVAVILLSTPPGHIRKLGEFTIAIIRNQYFSPRGDFYKRERRWKKNRVGLSESYGEVSDLPGQGDME